MASGAFAAAGAQSSVTVIVTDANTSRPVDQAQVFVVGTTIGGLTNLEGRYVLRNVASGQQTIRVVRVGYAEQKKSVALTGAQPAQVDFALVPAAVNLAPVVTTATGTARRVELGNAVSSISVADKIASVPIKSMGDLLVAKAAGVQVLPANMTGAGSRVRIRGTSSLALSNDPIYVIDGIRMNANSSDASIGVGGTSPSRVNDLSPDEIENIEIIKGPSAATLYGTAAANGVIVITTKKGRAGRSNWSVFTEGGMIQDLNHYPTQYAIIGHAPATPAVAITCMQKDVALGTCVRDSLVSLNIFDDPETTPIKDGNRNLLGLQLSGGTEAVRYFISGDVDNETGVFALPTFSRLRLDSLKADVTAKWTRPNTQQKASFRVNVNSAVSPKLDLAMTSNFISVNQRLPQTDNNVNSFFYNGTMGPGFKGAGPGYSGIGDLGQPLRGYAFGTPAEIFQAEVAYGIQRFIGGSNADWRPLSWLDNRVDLGVDLTSRIETSLCRFQQCFNFSTNRLGSARDARASVRNISLNYSSTGSYQARPWLGVKTTLGVQYGNYTELNNNASGSQLPPGAQTPGSGTIQTASSSTTLTKVLGLFVETAAAINDRLFLTAGLRTDQNSAFGTNFQRVYYPKGQISWVLSDEGFFPQPSWMDQLRLRFAVGSSGVQPGPNDALRTFSVVTTNVGNVDVSGLRSNALGNPNLKPERATEYEGGFETQLMNSRLSLDFTYYMKKTTDALINLTIAPSAGSSAASVRTNLGSVQNNGIEGQVTASLFSGPRFGWDVTFNGSHNSNKLLTLGTDLSGKPIPPIIGNTIRQVKGYPLNGYWQRPYTFDDANQDGIIVPSEVTVDTGFVFLGYSQPRNEVSITNSIDLFRRRLRLNVLADHKSGYRVLNSEQQFLCQQRTNGCYSLTADGAPLWDQARAIAQKFTPVLSQSGYIEQLSFWRLREVSATYTFSDNMAQRLLRAQGASITFGGRNLHVFTDWTGADPEQNYGQGDTQQTLLTAAPTTYYTVRLNIRY